MVITEGLCKEQNKDIILSPLYLACSGDIRDFEIIQQSLEIPETFETGIKAL